MGHSSGGVVAYRMACDHSVVAAIVSVAGAMYGDPSRCAASQPVPVRQVHGSDDVVVDHDGGAIRGVTLPSAETTARFWARLDSCAPQPVTAGRRDVAGDANMPPGSSPCPGAETRVLSFEDCDRGTAVELWTLEGAGRPPAPASTFPRDLANFLLSHPKG